eukprot:3447953-Amphidinium_carterae.1
MLAPREAYHGSSAASADPLNSFFAAQDGPGRPTCLEQCQKREWLEIWGLVVCAYAQQHEGTRISRRLQMLLRWANNCNALDSKAANANFCFVDLLLHIY